MDSMIFGVADYIVFGGSLLIALGIGIFHGCQGQKQSSSLEYHLGNKNIRTLPIAISVLVTTQSSILMLGVPAETYMYGAIIGWTGVAFCLAHFIAVRILIPVLYPLNLTSVHEVGFFNEFYGLHFVLIIPVP